MNSESIRTIMNSILSETHDRIFVMLVGAPCSNKTQLAEYIASFWNIPVVSPNDIRKQIMETNPDDFSEAKVFDTAHSEMQKFLRSDSVVIYDATNCYPKWRKRTLSELNGYYDLAICIQSAATLTDCILNNTNNGDNVPDQVIEKMHYNLEKNPPNLREGFDMILKYTI